MQPSCSWDDVPGGSHDTWEGYRKGLDGDDKPS